MLSGVLTSYFSAHSNTIHRILKLLHLFFVVSLARRKILKSQSRGTNFECPTCVSWSINPCHGLECSKSCNRYLWQMKWQTLKANGSKTVRSPHSRVVDADLGAVNILKYSINRGANIIRKGFHKPQISRLLFSSSWLWLWPIYHCKGWRGVIHPQQQLLVCSRKLGGSLRSICRICCVGS